MTSNEVLGRICWEGRRECPVLWLLCLGYTGWRRSTHHGKENEAEGMVGDLNIVQRGVASGRSPFNKETVSQSRTS